MYHKPVFATEIMFCSNPKNPITVEGTRAMPTPLYVDESSSLPQLRAWQVHWGISIQRQGFTDGQLESLMATAACKQPFGFTTHTFKVTE